MASLAASLDNPHAYNGKNKGRGGPRTPRGRRWAWGRRGGRGGGRARAGPGACGRRGAARGSVPPSVYVRVRARAPPRSAGRGAPGAVWRRAGAGRGRGKRRGRLEPFRRGWPRRARTRTRSRGARPAGRPRGGRAEGGPGGGGGRGRVAARRWAPAFSRLRGPQAVRRRGVGSRRWGGGTRRAWGSALPHGLRACVAGLGLLLWRCVCFSGGVGGRPHPWAFPRLSSGPRRGVRSGAGWTRARGGPRHPAPAPWRGSGAEGRGGVRV